MEDIKRTFKRYDRDSNGYISYGEAHQVLEGELGFDKEQTRRLLMIYDRNGDGRLSYEEFIWFYWKIQEQKAGLMTMFKKFDKLGTNSVSFEEAREILKDFKFTDREIENLLDLHDTNRDGLLQFEEFVHFWRDCKIRGASDNIK